MNAERIPDLKRALAHYALIAHRYDQETRKIQGIRQRAIDTLQLRAGQTVIDAGCGTGACLAALAQRVSPSGCVIGVEPSEHLIAHAHARVAGLPNVQLIHSCAERAQLGALDRPADAVLFCYTHDLMQSTAALAQLFAICRPGARVVATGTQLVPGWCWPVPSIQRHTHRHYITARDSMNLPYGVLSEYLDAFGAQRVFPWHSYLAAGALKAQHAKH